MRREHGLRRSNLKIKKQEPLEEFHGSRVTRKRGKAPGSSGGCKPGAGGIKQRQGRNNVTA